MNIGKDPLARAAAVTRESSRRADFRADYSQHALNCNAAPCRNEPKILDFLAARLAVPREHRYSSGRR
jgi:hypothetical protein